MTNEKHEKQKQLFEELLVSSNQDDYFAKRKYPVFNESVSGFLVAVGTLIMLSYIIFLGGGIDGISLRLIFFIILAAAPMGVLDGFYAVGSVILGGAFLLSMVTSWIAIYGIPLFFTL